MMDEVIDPSTRKLHIIVAEDFLASLVEGDNTEIKFVFRLENRLFLRHLQ